MSVVQPEQTAGTRVWRKKRVWSVRLKEVLSPGLGQTLGVGGLPGCSGLLVSSPRVFGFYFVAVSLLIGLP